jgi:CelD/BcsL family acetyltransferase involved in cellulose biosynthesis
VLSLDFKASFPQESGVMLVTPPAHMDTRHVIVTSSIEEAYAGFDLAFCKGFVFQHPEWLKTWLETMGIAHAVTPSFIRIVSSSGEPLMVAPFGISVRTGCRILSFLDAGVSDYNAPWFSSLWQKLTPDEASALWEEMQKQLPPHDVLMLNKIAEVEGMGIYPWHSLPHAPHLTQGHATKLETPWEQYYAKRASKRAKQKSRRALELLSQHGDVAFLQPHEQKDVTRIFETLIEQKRRKLLETRGTDHVLSPAVITFYDRLVEDTSLGHLSALLLNDEPVATHAGAMWQNRFYYLIPAFSNETRTQLSLEKFSPGKIHMLSLMEKMADSGCHTFDLGIGDESYKEGWSDITLPLFNVVKAHTLKGKLYLGGQRITAWLKSHDSVRSLARKVRKMRNPS